MRRDKKIVRGLKSNRNMNSKARWEWKRSEQERGWEGKKGRWKWWRSEGEEEGWEPNPGVVQGGNRSPAARWNSHP
jgi:hypothetical protein